MTTGFRDALRYMGFELTIQRRHFQSAHKFRKLSLQRPYKIQFGCGPNKKPGWINVDLFAEGADLHLDLREALPFPDNSAAMIYSEHFLSCLVYPQEVNRILSESLRVLEPGGVFSVGVADTAWPLESYVNRSEQYFTFSHGQGFLPKWCSTRMDVINEHFRGFGSAQGFGGNKYAYDSETLFKVLHHAGFVRVRERGFDPSLDSELRKTGTLYVEAHKPSP